MHKHSLWISANPIPFKMETYINFRINSVYICSSVRTKRRWLSKYTLSDKVSCIFTLVLFVAICISRYGECSRLIGAFASPCYRLDGEGKPIMDKPQVSKGLINIFAVLNVSIFLCIQIYKTYTHNILLFS